MLQSNNSLKKRVYMPINTQSFLKAIKSWLDVKGAWKDFSDLRTSRNNLKEIQRAAVIQKAQKAHKEKYGRNMSPSTLRWELESGFLWEEASDYLKNKRAIIKEQKRKNK